MIVQTFEQAFKKYLQTALAAYIDDKTLIISNDLSFKPFENDSNIVLGIIDSGGGNKTMMADVTDSLINISFAADANYLQDLLLHLNQFIDATQGVYSTLNVNTSTGTDAYTYQIKWKTPMMGGNPTDIRTNKSTQSLKIAICQLQGSIHYTKDVSLSPQSFTIRVNNNSVINLTSILVNYDITDAPQYKTLILFNYDHPVQVKLANNKVYHITSLKSSNITSYIINATVNYLELSLDSGSTWIPIASYSITEEWQNGVPVVKFLLTQGNSGTIDESVIAGNGSTTETENDSGIVLL